MSQDGTAEIIFRTLSIVLARLGGRLAPETAPDLFADLGVGMTKTQAAAITGALDKVRGGLTAVATLRTELDAAVAMDDSGAVTVRSVKALKGAADLIEGFAALSQAVAGLPGVTPATVQALPKRLLNLLVVDELATVPGLPETLEFAGILKRQDHNFGSVDPTKPFFTDNSFDLARLTGWLTKPQAQLAQLYGWGPGFNGTALLSTLERLLAQLGLPASLDISGPVPRLDVVAFTLEPKAGGLALRLDGRFEKGTLSWQGPDWEVIAGADLSLGSGSEILVEPDGSLTVTPSDPLPPSSTARLTATQRRASPAEPLPILAIPGGSGIEAREVSATFGIDLGGTRGGLAVGGRIVGGRATVGLGGADGFLGKILSGLELENTFDVGLSYSKDGLHFHGSGALEVQLASHVSLGPVELSALTLSVGLQDGKFPVRIASDIKAGLGPLTAIVEGLGFKLDVALKDNGNAGPVDLAPGFLSPRGVGLSLDAGPVRGGGYLFFDPAREEYAGAVEIDLAGIVTAKAIGLITTRIPDGSKGFSLLLLISVEFGAGLQLGFGFTLLAVGGLVGLNRTMLLQPLMEGVRTGSIESIMFPKDVVANAPKIISDLRGIFPPEEGRFLIGPMAKLGWGTPTLVSLSLGVIVEIPPGNIAIVGVLKVALPAEELPLIVLQVNFAGAIEVDKKRIYFFASLYESRILFVPLEGELGLLFAFGDDPNFVLSVGGFHPRFSPPPLPFPSPKRVSTDVLRTVVARIRVEAYFAVTTNTVQFGARAELFFGFDALNVNGYIGFDALIQFSPFHFVVQVSAGLSVDVFGAGLFSLTITLTLEGPSPWRAQGTGTIEILFFDVDVDIDVTWGERRDTTLPPIAVMPVFVAEIEKAQNWRAHLPASTGNLMVTLRTLPEAESAQVLHPAGVLRVTQRALPLGLKLDKVGNRKPNDVNRLGLKVIPGGLARVGDVLEQFAPAQFQDMDDAKKLSRPAYGPEPGGLDISAEGAQLASSRMVKRVVRYELIVIDSNYKRFIRPFFLLTASLFAFFLRGASIARCELSQARRKQLQPFAADDRIVVPGAAFTVAFQATNKAFAAEAAAFPSEASARDFLDRQVTRDPNLAEVLHVIPDVEMAA